MTDLRSYDWQTIYETTYGDEGTLVSDFFVPALERSQQYDRVAGYFNSGALAAASRGIESFIDSDGTMRLVVGTQLQEKDRPVIEALEEELDASDFSPSEEEMDKRIQMLAWLLKEGRLEIKVAQPTHGNWGIFHPKLGIFEDDNGNTLSFEGSINETLSGWTQNFERFKVHRSWVEGQKEYTEGDKKTFERLWNDEHPYVDVYTLSEALKEKLIEWKAPDTDSEVKEITKSISEDEKSPKDGDWGFLFKHGGKMPEGIHLAETISPITPWPHQRVVSDTLVNTYPNSFLMGDEVGLGKTIEVGLTLSRLGITGEMETGLILAPASLMTQWQDELQEKFNLNVWRYDRDKKNKYAFFDSKGGKVYPPETEDEESDIWRFVEERQEEETGPVLVLMSWHTARLESNWNDVAPENAQTRQEVPVSCRGRETSDRYGVWDTVVVDEAHSARKGTNLLKLLNRLREHTQTFYLMSATPMQLRPDELYHLLTLMDIPEAWNDKEDFVSFFETRAALQDVLENEGTSVQGGQQTLADENTVIQGLMQELEIDDRQEIFSRLESCCRLARSQGQEHSNFKDIVEAALDEGNIERAAGEDKWIKKLIYPKKLRDEETIIVTPNERRKKLRNLSEEGYRALFQILKDATPVSARIFRNTRNTLRKYKEAGILDETVPQRDAHTERIPLEDQSSDLRKVYDRIDEYTKTFYNKAQTAEDSQRNAIGFVMTIYRQRLASSVAAIRESLERRLDKLKTQKKVVERKQRHRERSEEEREVLESLGDIAEYSELADEAQRVLGKDITEVMPEADEEGKRLLDEEIQELESFIDDVRKIGTDPKIDQLRDDLQELDRKGHDRIIVFTQFVDTLKYIRNQLLGTYRTNIGTYTGDGGAVYDADTGDWRQVSKEHLKREFSKEDGDIEILICTDAASEGLNLQTCGALINYDLPWNPMKVEQRIGRIDRIGQQNETVEIINYTYENTVETDIYDSLNNRIDSFQHVLGDLQPILSTVSQEMTEAAMEGESDEARQTVETALEQAQDTDKSPVEESLKSVKPDVQDILEEARMDAWGNRLHPDIAEPGSRREDDITPPFTYESVQETVVDNILLEENGVQFEEAKSDIEEDIESRIYRMTAPFVETGGEESGDSIAADIVSHPNEAAITFDPDVAEQYPSLKLVLPGSRLFNKLASHLYSQGAVSLNVEQCGSLDRQDCQSGINTPIVVGLSSDGSRVYARDGSLEEDDDSGGSINEWCHSFIESRLPEN